MTITTINAATGAVSISQEDAPSFARPVTDELVRAEAARRMALIAAPYSPEERETWPVQIAEAEAVALDPAAPAPLLAALAAARGLTVEAMAQRVLLLRDQFRAAAGAILAAQATLLAMDPIPQDFTDDSRWT